MIVGAVVGLWFASFLMTALFTAVLVLAGGDLSGAGWLMLLSSASALITTSGALIGTAF